MLDFEKIGNEFYSARCGDLRCRENEIQEMWNKIKECKEVLKWAIEVKRNKWNDGDIVNNSAISEAILIDYKSVDQTLYKELVESIYTNKDIARTRVTNMTHNSSYSFLVISLCNHDLKLSEEQKSFAVSEATERYLQAHRWGNFDIRYRILRNPNWTVEEKQKLIMDFYDDEDYDEALDAWEWDIVNDSENYKGNHFPPFDKYELFNEWTYEKLLEFYGNQETTDRIWEEMEFCKQMHELRPQQWESQLNHPKKLV